MESPAKPGRFTSYGLEPSPQKSFEAIGCPARLERLIASHIARGKSHSRSLKNRALQGCGHSRANWALVTSPERHYFVTTLDSSGSSESRMSPADKRSYLAHEGGDGLTVTKIQLNNRSAWVVNN